MVYRGHVKNGFVVLDRLARTDQPGPGRGDKSTADPEGTELLDRLVAPVAASHQSDPQFVNDTVTA